MARARIDKKSGDRVGVHRALGGEGLSACSGDILLESLVACAGVTLGQIAKAMKAGSGIMPPMKYWEVIGDKLCAAGWSWGYCHAITPRGWRWVVDAHKGDGKRYVVQSDELVTAFLELELRLLRSFEQSVLDRRFQIESKSHRYLHQVADSGEGGARDYTRRSRDLPSHRITERGAGHIGFCDEIRLVFVWRQNAKPPRRVNGPSLNRTNQIDAMFAAAKTGQFKKEVNVGRSLASDRRRKAKTKVKRGQGDRGVKP